MHAPFSLLAAFYSLFLVFTVLTAAQAPAFPNGRGSQTTNDPSKPTDNIVKEGPNGHVFVDNRVHNAQPTGTHHPNPFPMRGDKGDSHGRKPFPNGHGSKNVPIARLGGHRISLKPGDRPKNSHQKSMNQHPVLIPAGNGTNGTNSSSITRRGVNPYRLPYVLSLAHL